MTVGRWMLVAASTLLAGSVLAAGRPSREEIEADRAAAFAEADADGSGTLSLEEFKTFHTLMKARMAARHFQKADANGDGVLTLEELAAAGPPCGRHGRGRSRGTETP
jgi:hypothetical protein